MEASQRDEGFCVLGGCYLTLTLTHFLDLNLMCPLFLDHLYLLYCLDPHLFHLYCLCPDPQTCCWCRRRWQLRQRQPQLDRENWRGMLYPARYCLATTSQGSADLVLQWHLLVAWQQRRLRLVVGGDF